MNRIYVARHGESTWNAEHRWTGHGDPPLSEVGRAQAREACEAFRNHRFDAVASSTLVRAVETASIIGSALGLPRLEPLRHFDERFAGEMSGMMSADIKVRWPGILEQWKSGTPMEIPGGEPWQAFVDRALEGLEHLQAIPGRILVVSHMGVQRAIEHGLGRPLTWYGNLEGFWVTGERVTSIRSSSISTIEYRPAAPSDTEAIANLHARSWRENYRGAFHDAFLDGDLPEERRLVWRDRLDHPSANQLVRLAVNGADLVGFVCAYGADDPQWGSLVDNLHVARAAKRGGIGSSLMRQAGSWLASRYPDVGVYLWVLEANSSARRFYERLGARNAGVSTMETHGRAMVRSCRYIWPRAALLSASGGRS